MAYNSGMIDFSESYRLFGFEALRQRVAALTAQVPAVRANDDIEAVHQMRVASRRLRAALALFGEALTDKHADDWQREIKRITKALGAARDTDVQFDWLKSFLAQTTDAACLPGINRLLLRLYQQRQRLQGKVIQTLDRLEASHTLDDLATTLREGVVVARLNNVDAHAPDVYAHAAEAIRLRLEEFLAYDVFVSQPDRATELHAMRIAAKHLRYTLEIFAELYADGLKKSIKTVKEIQELLGDIHDCDVWVAYVPQFIAEEQARTLEYFGTTAAMKQLTPGLDALRADRKRYRDKRYRQFVEVWDNTVAEDVWGKLRQTITRSENQITAENAESAETS